LLKGYWTTSSCYGKGRQNSKGKFSFRPWLNIDGITKHVDKSLMKSCGISWVSEVHIYKPHANAMNDWWEKKMLHKYDEMFFLLLDMNSQKTFISPK
jgi:hypothetical protein